MAQQTLRLAHRPTKPVRLPVSAEAIGLAYDDEAVTLRFMETLEWGRPVQQVRLDRRLAEQLTRLLNDELEDRSWV
jgi:hypothetical protein